MDLMNFIFKQALKIEVLHNIPGRLRLGISKLKNVSPELRPATETIEELLASIPGVKSITPNYITGSLLILYDQEVINKESIISSIQVIWKTLVTNRKQLSEVDQSEIKDVIKKIIDFLEKENIDISSILGEVKIPDEIWN